jgi:hypothetical protein
MATFTSRLALPLEACLGALLVACGGGGGGGGMPPPASTYGISVSVSGLSGAGLSLSVNGGPAVAISANGTVSLASGLADGSSYTVTVQAQPIHPNQTCAVTEGSGTIGSSNAILQVACSTAPTSAQTATQVSLGSDVSSTLSATITQVATGFGAGSVGGWVPIALPDDTSDLLLVAVDSTGSPVLAAMVTSTSTTLDANSTALALVRILLATTEGAAKPAQVNSIIEGAAGYSNLVTFIEADLGANMAPLADAKVEAALMSVATSAQAALPAASKVAGFRRAARVKQALGNPTMMEEGPFTVIPSANTNNPYFFITSLASAQTLTAHNAMALPWTAQTFTANSDPSVASTPLGPTVIVPAQTLFSGQQFESLSMTNSPFNFVLTQDQAALNQIASDFAQNLIEASVALTLSLQDEETCANQVAGYLAQVAPLSISKGGTFEATEDALLEALDPIAVKSILGQCGLSNTVSGAILYTAIEQTFLKTLSAALGYVSIASNANQILQEAWYANQQWNETYAVGVCAAQDYSINSCVASFQFFPTSLLMMPGASVSVMVTGKDSSGNPTLLPGDLTVNPSTPGVTDVTGTAPFNVTASANGTIQVDVLDPATGANNYQSPAQSYNPFAVTVTTPTLAPSAITLTVASTDQTFTVSLQAPGGAPVCTAALLEPCLSVPTDISWSATPTDTSVTPVTTEGSTGTWTLPANAASGSIAVTASAGAATYGPVTIEVRPNSLVTLIPSGTSVSLTNSDLFGAGATSGDGSSSQNCPSPCTVLVSSGSYSGTASVNDVDNYSGETIYSNSTLQGNVAFTAGANPTMTASTNWVVDPGAFSGLFGGTLAFTTSAPVTVTVTCTATGSSSTVSGASPCLPNCAAGTDPAGSCNFAIQATINSGSGASITSTSTTNSVQFTLPAAGQFTLTWQLVGDWSGGSGPGSANGTNGDTGSSTVTTGLSVVFLPVPQ